MDPLHHLHNCRQDSIATLLGSGQDPVCLVVVSPAHCQICDASNGPELRKQKKLDRGPRLCLLHGIAFG